MTPIFVEAPSEASARSLARVLDGRFTLEVLERGGHWSIAVTPNRSLDRLVVDLLDEVERWLCKAQVHEVQVHLDGRVYAMTRRDALG